LSDPRVTGKYTVRVELFFTIETALELRELIDLDRKEYKRSNMWIERKRTVNEHVTRVGFLTGPIVDSANLYEYDKMMKTLGGTNEGEVEVKRNMVYEGPESELCISVYSVRSAAEKVDFGL